MHFKEFVNLEEKKMLPAALLGASLLANPSAADAPSPITKTAEQFNQQELNILATTLIKEAGGEQDPNSMIAVLNVLQNRAKLHKSSMVKEALKPLQFSCWNDVKDKESLINNSKKHSKWNNALEIVKKGLNNTLKDITGGATHYHVWRGESKVSPDWTAVSLGGHNKKAIITKKIGNHVFLKNVD